jgi:hypothetical protein
MTLTATSLYGAMLPAVFSASINWTSDTIKMALVTGSYVPNLTTDSHWASISSYETSGTGYTAGGQALGSTVAGVLAYSSVGNRIASTLYGVDQVVSVGTTIYVCVVSGTTAITTPTFLTVQGQVTVDGTAQWACLGGWLAYFTSAEVSWNPLTVTARYGVLYDSTSGLLIALIDTGSSQSLSGPWALAPDPVSGWFFFTG